MKQFDGGAEHLLENAVEVEEAERDEPPLLHFRFPVMDLENPAEEVGHFDADTKNRSQLLLVEQEELLEALGIRHDEIVKAVPDQGRRDVWFGRLRRTWNPNDVLILLTHSLFVSEITMTLV